MSRLRARVNFVGVVILVLGMPAVLGVSGVVGKGSTRAELVVEFGEPEFSYRRGGEEVLSYLGLEVRLRDGKVVEMPYRMTEEIAKREGRREAKMAEQAGRSTGRGVQARQSRRVSAATGSEQPVSVAAALGRSPTVVATGGAEVDLSRYVGKGRITVVDFYADWCGPCLQVAPHLDKLVKTDGDVDVVKIDIVRWGTPVTQQYGIRSIPSMRVYDRKGKAVGNPTSSLSEVMARVKKAK